MAAAAAAVVDSVPEPERSVMLWVADLLCEVARFETANLMSLRALAIVMAPNLFAVPDSLGPAEVVQHMDVCVRGFQAVLVARSMTLEDRTRQLEASKQTGLALA
jgi:hypothetical protein